ncbi:MAG TPA: sugar ABC transporter substrate-binding protein [Firmicutes bacterium]|nr:sugar ABC transporter substrate-binding protein [Bacillota bacterium]
MRNRVLSALIIVFVLVSGIAEVEAAKNIKLTLWGWNIGIDALKAVASKFKETHPNVDFDFVEMNVQDVHDKLKASLMAGVGAPDICTVEQYYVQQIASKGGLVDLTKELQGLENKFARHAWVASKFRGSLYAIPWDIGPCALYYRKDIFDSLGVKPPRTWADFVTVGKKVAADLNGDGTLDRYMLNIPLNDPYGYFMFIWSKKLKIFDENGNLVVDNPEAFEVMKWYTDLYLVHHVALPQNYWEPAWFNAIKEGRLATIPMAVWFAGQLKTQAPELSGKWRVSDWPSATGEKTGTNWGGSTLVIPVQSKHKKEAIEFAKFMLATTEGQILSYKASNIFPAYLPALNSPVFKEPDPYFGGQVIGKIFVDSVPYISEWYYPVHMQAAEQAFNTLLAKVLNRKATLKEAWDEAIRAIKKEMAR